MTRVKIFGKKGKLNPCYICPYRSLSHFRKVADELELLADLASVHSLFHVSLLKKYIGDSASIIPLKSMDIKDHLSFEEVLDKILDHQICRLRNKKVPLVKVL